MYLGPRQPVCARQNAFANILARMPALHVSARINIWVCDSSGSQGTYTGQTHRAHPLLRKGAPCAPSRDCAAHIAAACTSIYRKHLSSDVCVWTSPCTLDLREVVATRRSPVFRRIPSACGDCRGKKYGCSALKKRINIAHAYRKSFALVARRLVPRARECDSACPVPAGTTHAKNCKPAAFRARIKYSEATGAIVRTMLGLACLRRMLLMAGGDNCTRSSVSTRSFGNLISQKWRM